MSEVKVWRSAMKIGDTEIRNLNASQVSNSVGLSPDTRLLISIGRKILDVSAAAHG